MKIIFLHGWQSVPGGVKPTFLALHGHEIINPALESLIPKLAKVVNGNTDELLILAEKIPDSIKNGPLSVPSSRDDSCRNPFLARWLVQWTIFR